MPAAYLPGDKVATSVLTRCAPQRRSGSRSDQSACRRCPRSSNRSMGRDAWKMRSDGASPNGRESARLHPVPLGREKASGAKRGQGLKRASADALPSQRPLPRSSYLWDTTLVCCSFRSRCRHARAVVRGFWWVRTCPNASALACGSGVQRIRIARGRTATAIAFGQVRTHESGTPLLIRASNRKS